MTLTGSGVAYARGASSPRQIAGSVIQSLLELISETPALRRLTKDGKPLHAMRLAFLSGKPPPIPPRVPPSSPQWRSILAAAQYATDVLACPRDSRAAWAAAAESLFWLGAAQGLLRPAALRRLAKEEGEQRKADGRKKGTDTTSSRRDERRLCARERYYALLESGPNPETGERWIKDDAAVVISAEWKAAGVRISAGTIRRKYLAGA